MGGSQGSQDLGKALLRIVLGVLILMHGIAKLTGATGMGFVAKVVADAGCRHGWSMASTLGKSWHRFC